MKIVTKIIDVKKELKEVRSHGKTIGFIPTMGYLHEGHLSLVRESLQSTDVTVVSIFINPAQFGPKEDFKEYPRNLERDSELLEKEGVDYLFVPDKNEIYPEGYETYIEVHTLQDKLCGRSRPGHFRGVNTVVLKFFNIICPDISFFGQKDAQQAVILKRMVQDLDLDVRIEVLPIIREKDGLALSSRNAYLNREERKAALVLSKSLKEAQSMIEKGERDSVEIVNRMREVINSVPLVKIDYIEIVDMVKLNPIARMEKEALAALAAYIGKVRLIDNTILRVEG